MKKQTRKPRDLISLKQASAMLGGIDLPRLRRWIHQGKLPGYRIGGTHLAVSRADVLELIEHVPITKPWRMTMWDIGLSFARIARSKR